jgi:hypothetical protein
MRLLGPFEPLNDVGIIVELLPDGKAKSAVLRSGCKILLNVSRVSLNNGSGNKGTVSNVDNEPPSKSTIRTSFYNRSKREKRRDHEQLK